MTTGGLPLSFAQDQLWFLDQLRSGATEYLLHQALRLRGPLDVTALTAALTEITGRHEILRTRYLTVAGEPTQVIDPSAPVSLREVDLSMVDGVGPDLSGPELSVSAGSVEPGAGGQALDTLLCEQATTPFDLSSDHPVRWVLARLNSEEHVLALTVHHIAFDGWSWGVLATELSTLYAAFTAGERSTLPEIEIQYADYADWQREWWESSAELRETQLGYWRDRLAGLAPLELPTDRPRPDTWDAAGDSVDLVVPAELAGDLAKLGAAAGATPFMVYLAAFQVLLSRYSGQHDIAVGVSVAGRNQVALERLIGLFVNTVVMRTDLTGTPSFAELLTDVRETTLDAYGHQDVPFERVVAALAPERDLSRNPLFQVAFGLHNWHREPFALAGLDVAELATPWTSSAFDLSLHLFEHDDGRVTGQLLYPVALFDRARVDRVAAHYVRLLASIAAAPDAPVSTLDLLTEPEAARLTEWNRTELPRPDVRLPTLVRAQALSTPDATAVVAGDRRHSYRTLMSDVDGLVDWLVAQGVTAGTPVGVHLGRGTDLVVALLAILEAGGVYVPLPVDLPAERRAYMAEDAGVALVLDEVRSRIGTAPAAPRPDVDGRAAAYVMYTSGSTGRPKGVVITHDGIRNRVLWSVERYGMTAADRVLQKTALGFDAAMWELLAPLVSGGAVVMAPEGAHHDPAAMVRAVIDHDVTILQLVP
ncbi:condensation domain-containing protein, partial [Actinophytocola sp.]|uniref:condensation domain-containing protein n=1 Tax=Actinophytocola sp. TaxID=1872138 RepID=UPI00389A9317